MESKTPGAEELERLQTALKQAQVTLFQQDRQLRYTRIQHPFPGLDEQSIVGKMDTDFLPEDEAREVLRLKRAALESGEPQSALVRMTFKGQERTYFLSVHPLSADGLSGTAVDITGNSSLFSRPPLSLTAEPRAQLLASLSRSFAETGNDYPAVLETITRQVAQTAGDAAMIWEWRPARGLCQDRAELTMVAFQYTDAQANAWFRSLVTDLPAAVREEISRRIYPFKDPVLIEDLIAREDLQALLPLNFAGWLQAYPIHSLMVLPLRTPRGMLGILCAWRSASHLPYSMDDLVFWQDIADRAALAIENARLYAEEVHRNRQLNALHDATTALLSTLDLEVLLGRILDAVQRAIPASEQGILYLIAPRTGRLEVRATSGFKDPRIRRTSLLHNRHVDRAMRERRPLLICDMLEEKDINGAQAEIQDYDLEAARSAIISPLVLGSDVHGALSLAASQPSAFTSSDLQLLASFAATTTAALHNAMLHNELQKIAITDPLTGLYNRRGLIELGRHEVERFQRFGQPLSAIMIDIDHFKRVNDTYGHTVGDQVLCGLADRCSALVRQVDILGRYGGEEFAIILPETDLFQASAVAERLRRAVEERPFNTEQGLVSITVSLGASRAGRDLSNLVELIEQADAALYQAKQKGRNRVELG